ncbi:LPD25 domain-containing protein [Lederbergia lenta]|uniref:LPD25 domain-containing protein n=1 Tax=Lederbergia lenta TaxID=1467 RepID=UPI00203E4AFE|nr:LPD25 domain-containing protein [Lederbergia lenta]MCM3109993.1 hypothetical protein [Lederbergia lenta]
MTTQIKVKEIKFNWSESAAIENNTIVSTFEEANMLVYKAAINNTRPGYDKTEFTITWEDGRTHNGRIDIENSHANKVNPIGEHVKYFYESLSGLRKPSAWTDEEYKSHLKAIYKIDEQGMEEMKEVLKAYVLDDVPEEMSASESTTIDVKEEVNTITLEESETPVCESESQQDQSDVYYKLNEEKNGVEIYFNDKPSEEIRNQLKANKFRYSRNQNMWYAKQSDSTLELAKQLSHNSEREISLEHVSYPEIEINDCMDEKYNISQELQDREHDSAWIFRKNKRDHNKELRELFQSYTDVVKNEIEHIENEYYIFKLKESLQRFKKKYHETYVKWISAKAAQPSWAVTGRGNLNVDRYNKSMSHQDKLMMELATLPDELNKTIQRYRYKSIKDKENAIREKAAKTEINIEFKTEQKEFIFLNRNENKRVYSYGDYFICKTWGAFRIFKDENDNVKEVHSMKTNEKLMDAKKYLNYIIQQQQAS